MKSLFVAVLTLGAACSPAQQTAESSVDLISASDLSGWDSPAADHRLAYGDDPLQFGDLYLPEGPPPHPVVVFIHGGCWLSEYDIAHSARLARALADTSIAVWSIEYRRVGDPGGGWPNTFLDVERGAGHLSVIAADYDLDLGRVIVAGHSAGGHLALWLGARSTGAVSTAPFDTAVPVEFRGVLGLAPAPDLGNLHQQEICGHVVDELMGGGPADVPERYQLADATRFFPIGLEQILLVGRHDQSWAPSARRYFELATLEEEGVRLIEAEDSGHFELIDPTSSSFEVVRESVFELLELQDR